MIEDKDPGPPEGPPPNWKNETLEKVINIHFDPPHPEGEPEPETEIEVQEEQSWFGKILNGFKSKNLVDGQFEYGVPGLGEFFSALQSFALWGPNLVLADTLVDIFSRWLEVSTLVLDMDW